MNIWYILPVIGTAAGMVLASRGLLHFFQLESYQFHGFFKTLIRQRKRAFSPGLVLAAIQVVLLAIGFHHEKNGRLSVLFCMAAGILPALAGLFFHIRSKRILQKKKFVLTARMKRLYAVLSVICVMLAFVPCLLYKKQAGAVFFFISCLLPLILLPAVIALAAAAALPTEKSINRMYMQDARRRMDMSPGLIRIGITGSYGKTSVKNILYTILSQKYNVLSTPASFNTPMGLTRVIRERLEPAHQIFLAEMGARHRKDIKELTDFIRPTIGILTSVGPQHLDTFKTLEAITETKYDLIRSLPDNGYAVFSNDSGICLKLYEQTHHVSKALTGRKGGAVWAQDISVSDRGSTFTLCFEDGKKLPCETRLLGAHNISNILLSCAVARHLGLSDSQIQRGIGLLAPVEHRLQIIRNAGGITVIDDAYNSNPKSVKAALDVLKMFHGRRIVVTPGMVELGDKEDSYNREFGRNLAESTDMCLLIGQKHTLPIREGLTEAGYDTNKIHVFSDLASAVSWLQGIMQAGDTVMYENDLPDHYSEN